ncbi:MAG: NAD(P)-dependent oxidoreductase [Gammaproteobacteria bacterium]
MSNRIFLAGATGVIGARLAPMLIEAGYDVFGMTRLEEKRQSLIDAGVRPVVADVYDAPNLVQTMKEICPGYVIHQLTDLPDDLDPAKMDEAIRRNARIRREGTRNLVDAATASGVRRFIAQSIAWAYAPGLEPYQEDDPLDTQAEGRRAVTVGGVALLEELTLNSPPLEGIVLRYGHLYGPGTGVDGPGSDAYVHVDAAACAALLAIDTSAPTGVFNIAEPNGHVSADKAIQELGWTPDFHLKEKRQCLAT